MTSTSMRTHLCGEVRPEQIGQTVSVCGWVARRREHGEHLAFVDLRDHSGIVQCVVDNDVDVRSEYVLRVTGVVRERPEGTINDQLPTGHVEIGDCEVEILSEGPVYDNVWWHNTLFHGMADEHVVLRFKHQRSWDTRFGGIQALRG